MGTLHVRLVGGSLVNLAASPLRSTVAIIFNEALARRSSAFARLSEHERNDLVITRYLLAQLALADVKRAHALERARALAVTYKQQRREAAPAQASLKLPQPPPPDERGGGGGGEEDEGVEGAGSAGKPPVAEGPP